jgi:hypothetical protein
MPENNDEFGFAAVSAREKIRQIKPTTPPETHVDIERVDAVAESSGFISREPTFPDFQYQAQRRQRPQPTVPLNMRAPVNVATVFKRFCEENRYSYPEGLSEIMRRAGLPTK